MFGTKLASYASRRRQKDKDEEEDDEEEESFQVATPDSDPETKPG